MSPMSVPNRPVQKAFVAAEVTRLKLKNRKSEIRNRKLIRASLRRLLLLFCHRPPVFEFRPEPADAFGACARIPSETGAEKIVFLFALQFESEGFYVELPEFRGVLHPLGNSFGQC